MFVFPSWLCKEEDVWPRGWGPRAPLTQLAPGHPSPPGVGDPPCSWGPSLTCCCGNGCRGQGELLCPLLLEVSHFFLGEGHLLHPQVHHLARASQPIGAAAWGVQGAYHLSALEDTWDSRRQKMAVLSRAGGWNPGPSSRCSSPAHLPDGLTWQAGPVVQEREGRVILGGLGCAPGCGSLGGVSVSEGLHVWRLGRAVHVAGCERILVLLSCNLEGNGQKLRRAEQKTSLDAGSFPELTNNSFGVLGTPEICELGALPKLYQHGSCNKGPLVCLHFPLFIFLGFILYSAPEEA